MKRRFQVSVKSKATGMTDPYIGVLCPAETPTASMPEGVVVNYTEYETSHKASLYNVCFVSASVFRNASDFWDPLRHFMQGLFWIFVVVHFGIHLQCFTTSVKLISGGLITYSSSLLLLTLSVCLSVFYCVVRTTIGRRVQLVKVIITFILGPYVACSDATTGDKFDCTDKGTPPCGEYCLLVAGMLRVSSTNPTSQRRAVECPLAAGRHLTRCHQRHGVYASRV